MNNPKLIQPVPSNQPSVALADCIIYPPIPLTNAIQLLSGRTCVVTTGFKQQKIVNYYWLNEQEKDKIMTLPIIGVNILFPEHEKWSVSFSDFSQISETIHLFNVTVTGTRFLDKFGNP